MNLIDPYPDNTANTLLEMLAISADEHCYVLLDHSFQPKLTQMLGGLPWQSLYEAHGAETEISPILCKMSQEPAVALEQFGLLLQLTQNQPMLSFWCSPLPFEQIGQHFVSYTDVVLLPEKILYLLRYADTRIQPYWIAALNLEQRKNCLAPFTRYLSFDRAAKPILKKGADTGKINIQHLEISETQFNWMLEQSQPDQIIADLQLAKTHVWHQQKPSEQFAQITKLCEEAREQKYIEFNAIGAYCLRALLENPDDVA